jgi:hypothetical protein
MPLFIAVPNADIFWGSDIEVDYKDHVTWQSHRMLSSKLVAATLSSFVYSI